MSLSPEAERLLARTKNLDDPSQADRAAMRARLEASWLAAAPLSEPSDVGRQASSSWTKLVWGVMSVVALVGAGVWLRAQLTPATLMPSAPSRVTSVPGCTHDCAPVAESARARAERALDPALEPPTPSAVREPEPLRRAVRAGERSASAEQRRARTPNGPRPLPPSAPTPASAPAQAPAPAPAPAPQFEVARAGEQPVRTQPGAYANAKPLPAEPVPEQAPAPAPAAIDEELALLGEAQDALRAGRPDRALRLVQQHGFRFPNGALAQERMTVHVLALCALSRPNSARQVYAQLQRSAAESPVLARVRADCGF